MTFSQFVRNTTMLTVCTIFLTQSALIQLSPLSKRLVYTKSCDTFLIPPFNLLCKPLFLLLKHFIILDQTKLRAFADDKFNLTKMVISVFDREENVVGKGEIACTSNFSFIHNVFKRLLSQRRQKVSLCGNGLMGGLPLLGASYLIGDRTSLMEVF